MIPAFLMVYLFFCILVANVAKDVAIGFWGVLIMSMLLTPLLTGILVLLLKPKPKKKKGLENLDLEEY